MSLKNAHKGYQYQDLSTAVSLARMLVRSAGTVTVDRKEGANDKFDDITERIPGVRVSRQLKWTEKEDRLLLSSDFTTVSSTAKVSVDKLVLAHKGLNREPETEVRLAVCWGHPDDAEFLKYLAEDATLRPTFDGTATRRFRLRAEVIWPASASGTVQDPVWAILKNVSRAEFIAFAEDFVVETGLPPCSRDLTAPGELEIHLFSILRDRVGIGEFPNHGRSVEDVAARLIQVATTARADSQVLTPAEVAAAINLQTDFGCVVQTFPFQREQYVARGNLRDSLCESVRASNRLALVGAPGCGKSWELTTLAEALSAEGHLVARHYCYISPSDRHREARITARVMYGNLIDELLHHEPSLVDEKLSRYSANAVELQGMISAAVQKQPGRRVVIIVDGLDHIDRVMSDAQGITLAQASIIDDLVALDWPDGSCLVVGSQPGSHLAQLVQSVEQSPLIHIPGLDPEEVEEILNRSGLGAIVDELGQREEALDRLVDRADGNALYATMLIRGALEACAAHGDPRTYLLEAPDIQGDLNRYYEYLYDQISEGDHIIADVLGVIDFAVTQDQLVEIVGPLAGRQVGSVVSRLAPLLVEVTGRGGWRIFHESFRRHIVERAEGPEAAVELAQYVVRWLDGCGFHDSGLSFRNLLNYLARAHRYEDLFERVGPSFVSEAVKHCHGQFEIEANLEFAGAVAAARSMLPEIVRVAHLLRATATCFDEHLSEPEPFWEAHLALFGADVTAQRLAPDGHPILSRNVGLRLCSRIADAGAVPPWGSYLDLPREEPHLGADGPGGDLYGRTLAALLHGRLALYGVERPRAWISKICAKGSLPRKAVIRVAERWVLSDAAGLLDFLGNGDLSEPACSSMAIAAAEADSKASPQFLVIASASASPDTIARCLRLGAQIVVDAAAITFPDLTGDEVRCEEAFRQESAKLRKWFCAGRLAAFVQPERLATVTVFQRPGWYWAWLTFCTRVFRADACRDPAEASKLVVSAFADLAGNSNPFEGKPRACDLSGIRGFVWESLRLALRNVQVADWSAVLGHLQTNLLDVSTYLQGWVGGPIGFAGYLRVLVPFAHISGLRTVLSSQMSSFLTRTAEDGQLYSNKAENELLISEMLAVAGDRDAALGLWNEAAVSLTGYSYRRDQTIFELIESLEAFKDDEAGFLNRVERLWPLVDAVIAHTDRKDTRHAPNALLAELAKYFPAAALGVVTDDILGNEDALDGISEGAYMAAIRSASRVVSPRLSLLAETTIRFNLEGGRPERSIRPVAEVALRTSGSCDPMTGDCALRLEARVQGDSGEVDFEQLGALRDAFAGVPYEANAQTSNSESAGEPEPRKTSVPTVQLPPSGDSLLDFMIWFRSAARARNGQSSQQLATHVAQRCSRLETAAQSETSDRLLDFVCRCFPASLFLQLLSAALETRGLLKLASRALVVAFFVSRGGGGWRPIGDAEHVHVLDDAERLDPVEAKAEFARQVSEKGLLLGVTWAVINRLSHWDPAAARRAWDEAFSVVAGRLKTVEGRQGWLPRFRVSSMNTSNVEKALVGCIAARCSHPEVDRRTSALLAFAYAVKNWPAAAGFALSRVIGLGPSPTSTLELLQVVHEVEASPFEITLSAQIELRRCLDAELFGVRQLAASLLARAGVAESLVVSPSPPTTGGSVEDWLVDGARYQAGEARVDVLTRCWPAYPEILAACLRRRNERRDDYPQAQGRVKFAGKEELDRENWIPTVQWLDEMTEESVHEAANGIIPHMLQEGELNAESTENVLSHLLPNLSVQLGVVASRVPRPKLSRPSECEKGKVGLAETIREPFEDWVRIGLYEHELIEFTDKWPRQPIVRVTRHSGMVAHPKYATHWSALASTAPLWSGDSKPSILTVLADLPAQPLVGLGFVRRPPIKLCPILIFPNELARSLGLSPGPFPGPLTWVDGDGARAVRFRAWEMSPTRGGERPSEILGCDLLVRRDIFDRIEAAARGHLSMKEDVFRQQIVE